MKRLRSTDDIDFVGKESNMKRSSSFHGKFHYQPEKKAGKGLMSSSSPSSRYDRDRCTDEGRDGDRAKVVRKRFDHDFDSSDRRKGFDRYKESGDSRGFSGCSGGSGDRSLIHRSESFCPSRRDFPKGFRSERDRPRREGSLSSWRRFGSGAKDSDEINRVSRPGLGDRVSVRSAKGLRDVKSPTGSKDYGSEQRRLKSPTRECRDEKNKSKSKSKSPSWSKNSAASEQSKSEQSKSEQSKSVEVKKAEDLQVESGGTGEMEEGELQPEPNAKVVPQLTSQVEPRNGDCSSVKLGEDSDEELQKGHRIEDTDIVVEMRSESMNEGEVEPHKEKEDTLEDNEGDVDPQKENKGRVENNEGDVGPHKENEEMGNEALDELPDVQTNASDRIQCFPAGTETSASDGSKEDECMKEIGSAKEETQKEMGVEQPLKAEEENGQCRSLDLVVKEEADDLTETNKEASREDKEPELNITMMAEAAAHDLMDKGKSVCLSSPQNLHAEEDHLWLRRQSRDLISGSDDAMEGPSIRGLELFSCSPVRNAEKKDPTNVNKHKAENLTPMPLDLSLSLPNVLLPIGATANETAQDPGSPGQSFHSLSTFRTNSGGFTASLSLSGSQSFFHNPSCSLTQNSVDYENSVGSKPLFKGIDQVPRGSHPEKSQNDTDQKDLSLLRNDSAHQTQASNGVSDGQGMRGHPLRVAEGSSRMPNNLERTLSLHEQLYGESRCPRDVKSPPQSIGSHDIGSNYSFDKRGFREKSGGSLNRNSSQKRQEKFLMAGTESIQTFIARMVFEPVDVMANQFHEMTAQLIAHLKQKIMEFFNDCGQSGQVLVFQKDLQNRSDITPDLLKMAHRVQLEILVALKTGMPEFLQAENIETPDLTEIFVGVRCRNPNCRSQIEECDCKVCTQKDGFCSNCMCLVCGKFDMAANTCSWVGCDVCLHWCHTDCGIRQSFIRNGRSTCGSPGRTEMQFHCVACNHPSEMYGFVKEVFQNFANEWSAEMFCKELEYVKRIFSASKDSRGRRLHEIADQMLVRLANRTNVREVCSNILSFFADDADSSKLDTIAASSGKEQIKLVKDSNVVARPGQEASWVKPVCSDKSPQFDRPNNVVSNFINDRSDKRIAFEELHTTSSHKEFGFENLESVVKIKLAEAKMFQARADDARRDAEGLKRIAIAKNEKIEEEYDTRIAKLRLEETEEMRKQRFEELQTLERSHMEYFSMKIRMEADIKELLSKMEATTRNLGLRTANQ